MRIIVTGSNGFLGKHMVAYCKEKRWQVETPTLRIDNLSDFDFLSFDADAIVHAGGIAHDINGKEAVSAYKFANTDLSIKLIQAFFQSNIRDFIFISSVKAVAETTNVIIDENTVPHPESPYGISKYEVEQYIQTLKVPENKRIFILQPCLMYGAGVKGNLATLIQFVLNGKLFPFASFESKRSYLNIDNLNYIITTLLQNRTIKNNTFLLSDDEALSTTSILVSIHDFLKTKARLLYLPQWFVKSIAKIGDVIKLPVNSKMLAKLADGYVVDNSKIKKVLGIEKMPFNWSDGLPSMINFAKSKSV